MAFELRIDTDNTAFADGAAQDECARILRDVADKLEQGRESGSVRDFNGNKVGTWSISGGAS